MLDLSDPDTLIDGLAAAQGNHVAATHWVMTPQSFAALRKMHVGETDARYLLDPNMHEGTQFTLFGLPVIITDYIPNASGKGRVALVDFSKVVVGPRPEPDGRGS
ncbi:phage major capsid protein [Mycobacteroides abscessus]|uniref:phage major capsid protein n=1 Tax=Mycobacteroides abscessus TaxID=36809 RepID=UPI001D156458|nr:phage major capsid protein [Mycobacteroides abscessus]UEA49534.1 phage major capsid protein [Mycobacteroides abscessus subsp. abscessus]UEA54659.1 phage major capsid protein [Mycobacteroides abscessus]